MPSRGAPKPQEFSVTELQAGKRRWQAGPVNGATVTCRSAFFPAAKDLPQREFVLVGKALFGMSRFAFEVQEINRSPAAIKKLLAREKELREERFGPGLDDFGAPSVFQDFVNFHRAELLGARHSIQVKFQDIESVTTEGRDVLLKLRCAPSCYVKPEGEDRGMEVCKDITGGAKTLRFMWGVAPTEASTMRLEKGTRTFDEVLGTLIQADPRLGALFQGLPPPVEEPKPAVKRKRSNAAEGQASSSKSKRIEATPPEAIASPEGSWLRKCVDRFGLVGPTSDNEMSEALWEKYFRARTFLEVNEGALLTDSEANTFEGALWPAELGAQPALQQLCMESYLDPEEETETDSKVLDKIRSSERKTIASTTLKLDHVRFAQGIFLREYWVNGDGGDEPRTVTARAVIFSPLANGRFVELSYHNHQRVRSSFTERSSELYALKGHMGEEVARHIEANKKAEGLVKLFELTHDDARRKNKTRTSLASHAVVAQFAEHLFGPHAAAVSNRKVFGMLVRAVGLGHYGEHNGWPIAAMRKRFKLLPGESGSDTEKVPGEDKAEPSLGGCCVM